MAKESGKEKYTDPDLRERIKEEIKASGKGGNPGQWSARKSQLLAREYEKRGGGYTGDKDERQRNLERWTDEEWRTKEGEARAREDDKTRRYLPKEAWEKMSDEEKRATESRKRAGSREGEQYVENTDAAKSARGDSKAPPLRGYDDLTVGEIENKIQGLSKAELSDLRDYEKRHENRKRLLETLDRRLEDGS
jgi:hypothetical protein